MRFAMIAYSFYETDTRIIRYAECLKSRGGQVDVFALRRENQGTYDVIRGVNLYRLQKREYNEKGPLSYLYKILKFMGKSGYYLARSHRRNPYNIVHVHNVPDFLVFAALYPKLRGAKVILDIHDILPEFFSFKFQTSPEGRLFKLLSMIEKISMALADHVIVSNHVWEERLLSRSVGREKCSVILNYPEEKVFSQREEYLKKHDKFIMLYPGSLLYQQGVDVAIKAFGLISREVPDAEFHIYGEGNKRSDLESLSQQLGLNGKVVFKGQISADEIVGIMQRADLGIEPKRGGLFAGEALSMKIMEFMAAGVPVIASNTDAHKYYFNESVVQFFNAEDERDLAHKMILMIHDSALREDMAKRGKDFVQEYSWEKNKQNYLDLINILSPAKSKG